MAQETGRQDAHISPFSLSPFAAAMPRNTGHEMSLEADDTYLCRWMASNMGCNARFLTKAELVNHAIVAHYRPLADGGEPVACV